MNKLKLLFFNSNGINDRIDDLKKFGQDQDVDLCFVVETHLHPNDRIPFQRTFLNIPAYRGPGNATIGGIMGFRLSNTLRNNQIKILDTSRNWAVIKIYSEILAVTYFPPSCEFTRLFPALIDKLQTYSNDWDSPVTLFGDFNARHNIFGDHHSAVRGVQLKKYLEELPFMHVKPILGNYTTGNTSGGKGVTDLVLKTTIDFESVTNLSVFENETLNGSDHRPITWEWSYGEVERCQLRTRWNLLKFTKNPESLDLFLKHLDETKPAIPQSIDTNRLAYLDNLWSQIENWIRSSLDVSCGRKNPFKYHRNMFWTPSLIEESRTVNQAYLDPHSDNRRELYKRYALNRKKRHEEMKRYFLDEICKTRNRGQFFRYVKKLNRPYTPGNLQESEMPVYESHFKSTFGMEPSGKMQLQDSEILSRTDRNNLEVYESPLTITVEEVEQTIQRLGRFKAPGVDEIPAEPYIFGCKVIAPVLYDYFNLLLKYQLTPSIQFNSK